MTRLPNPAMPMAMLPLSCVPEEFTLWHFRTKYAVWNSRSPKCQQLLFKWRGPSYGGPAMTVQNILVKTGDASPAGSPMGKRPRVRQRTRWSDYIFDLSWSCLSVELWPSSEEKRAWKWMKTQTFEAQYTIIHRSSHLSH